MSTEIEILTDKQIDQIAMDVHVRCVCIPGASFYNAADKAIQSVLQSPEVQALRKDAERLDWLERHFTNIGGVYRDSAGDVQALDLDSEDDTFVDYVPTRIRSAIDAAMEKKA